MEPGMALEISQFADVVNLPAGKNFCLRAFFLVFSTHIDKTLYVKRMESKASCMAALICVSHVIRDDHQYSLVFIDAGKGNGIFGRFPSFFKFPINGVKVLPYIANIRANKTSLKKAAQYMCLQDMSNLDELKIYNGQAEAPSVAEWLPPVDISQELNYGWGRELEAHFESKFLQVLFTFPQQPEKHLFIKYLTEKYKKDMFILLELKTVTSIEKMIKQAYKTNIWSGRYIVIFLDFNESLAKWKGQTQILYKIADGWGGLLPPPQMLILSNYPPKEIHIKAGSNEEPLYKWFNLYPKQPEVKDLSVIKRFESMSVASSSTSILCLSESDDESDDDLVSKI